MSGADVNFIDLPSVVERIRLYKETEAEED
jgi:hypothetical protein